MEMLWYEKLECIFNLVAALDGGSFELNYTSLNDYYAVVAVFGKPDT